ncbi:hypothetical protein LguiA_029851 [Lonicera macranthoides]
MWQKINAVFTRMSNDVDQCIWDAESDGRFTLKSAWSVCRFKRSSLYFSKLIWHHIIPLKWSTLAWIAVNKRLPLDDVIKRRGIQLASRCNCCSCPKQESIKHVFVSSRMAQSVWSHFEEVLSIHSRGSRLQLKLNEWWLSKVRSPCFKVILSFIPMSICWELWRARNQSRFEGGQFSATNIILNVRTNFKAVFSSANIIARRSENDSRLLCNLGVEFLGLIKNRIWVTQWVKPHNGRVKLNADGCSKGNPGHAGGGCLLRNDQGRLIWAQADYFGLTSNMVAETRALLMGIRKCVWEGWSNIEVEVDSLILVQVVKQQIRVPWCIHFELKEIMHLLGQVNFQISHIYRESNKCADFLANIGCKERVFLNFVEFESCPHYLKGLLKIDRAGLPSLRVRKY